MKVQKRRLATALRSCTQMYAKASSLPSTYICILPVREVAMTNVIGDIRITEGSGVAKTARSRKPTRDRVEFHCPSRSDQQRGKQAGIKIFTLSHQACSPP